MSSLTPEDILTDVANSVGYPGQKPLIAVVMMTALRRMPRWLLGGSSWVLAQILPILARRDMRTLFANVEAVYRLPRHSSFAQAFARQVVRHTAYCQLETMKLMVSRDSSHLVGLEELRATLIAKRASGRGVLVITAHLGSWEMVAQATSFATGTPFFALAKPPSREWLRPILQSLRTAMSTAILWTDRKTLLRDMLTIVKAGGCLGFVMDQKPRGGRGHLVPFMGVPTAFVQGPASIADKSGAAIVAIFCVREGPWRYRVIHHVIGESVGEEISAEGHTASMAAAIESMIRCFPEQWTWNYRRWNEEQLVALGAAAISAAR